MRNCILIKRAVLKKTTQHIGMCVNNNKKERKKCNKLATECRLYILVICDFITASSLEPSAACKTQYLSEHIDKCYMCDKIM